MSVPFTIDREAEALIEQHNIADTIAGIRHNAENIPPNDVPLLGIWVGAEPHPRLPLPRVQVTLSIDRPDEDAWEGFSWLVHRVLTRGVEIRDDQIRFDFAANDGD